MSQPGQVHINQLQTYRPACSQCGAPTTLARIEPSDVADHDTRTFECVSCMHKDTASIRYR